jgi:hypothetical protein
VSSHVLQTRSARPEGWLWGPPLLVAALTVVMGLVFMGLGLAGYVSMMLPWKHAADLPRREAKPIHVGTMIDPRPSKSPQREMSEIQKLLADVRMRSSELSEAEQEQQSLGAGLRETKSQLTMDVEKQRKALREAEEAVRRYQQDQERAAQHLAELRAEAAELERKAAALRSDVAEARRSAAALETSRGRAIQYVECASDGVVLKPQLIHIASGDLGNGVLARLARTQGVYFLVRPDGFDSFNRARDIAIESGRIIGFEPMRSSAR